MAWSNYKLVTFGCSHTYGHGLKDCLGEDSRSEGPYPSKYAWPEKLKDLVNFTSVDNCAIPGSSNKMITKSIIEYPHYTKNTVVVILWSNFNRQTIFEDQKNIRIHMLPAFIKQNMPLTFWRRHKSEKTEFIKTVKTYYENYYEQFDTIFDQLIRINYVHGYLKNKGIKSFHVFPEHEIPKKHKEYFDNFYVKNVNLKNFIWETNFYIDEALDKPNPHPGHNSHALFAANLKKWFFK